MKHALDPVVDQHSQQRQSILAGTPVDSLTNDRIESNLIKHVQVCRKCLIIWRLASSITSTVSILYPTATQRRDGLFIFRWTSIGFHTVTIYMYFVHVYYNVDGIPRGGEINWRKV